MPATLLADPGPASLTPHFLTKNGTSWANTAYNFRNRLQLAPEPARNDFHTFREITAIVISDNRFSFCARSGNFLHGFFIFARRFQRGNSNRSERLPSDCACGSRWEHAQMFHLIKRNEKNVCTGYSLVFSGRHHGYSQLPFYPFLTGKRKSQKALCRLYYCCL